MAVYKIFPEKSATLYSFYTASNAGLDEILETSIYKASDDTAQVSRALVKFPTTEINDTINNLVGTASYDAYLKLYLADASEIPLDYTLYTYPVSADWNRGTGRIGNNPPTVDGVSWTWRTYESGSAWSSAGGDYNLSYAASQSFVFSDSKDIEMKVTPTVAAWKANTISNYGFLLKNQTSLEFQTSSVFELKYFSGNTHTIYPPCLEIRWNDFRYNTGSLSLVTSAESVFSLANNKNEFQQDSVQRFRINVRDRYPSRTFRTQFTYLTNKVMPTASYWSIVDLDSQEIVVDYDTTYTKISADPSGSYFDVYMNGLEPERYYKLLFKTTIAGSTMILDEQYYFKVIR
jgi:hypothetical protein